MIDSFQNQCEEACVACELVAEEDGFSTAYQNCTAYQESRTFASKMPPSRVKLMILSQHKHSQFLSRKKIAI